MPGGYAYLVSHHGASPHDHQTLCRPQPQSPPHPQPPPPGRRHVDVSPVGASSPCLLERADHALFGVSTGNSYFSRGRLAKALGWAAERFAAVDVVHADVALESMLEAFGYEPDAARRSAAKQLRGVRRRIEGALEDLGPAAERVRARPLSAFLDQTGYREVRGRTRTSLRTDMELRAVRDRMAYQFLTSRLEPDALPAPAQVQAALEYVDAELPFFVDSPRILGVASSVHCYHTVLALGRLLFGGRRTGLNPAENQGYAIVTCRD
ncbi:tRNA-dependent cyclodipeptide synthase [Streptomyces beihaiensis]|uniref:Cyclodipeptide synthase n=1 Tax=Streptomyces beihaiensis TaxID=2984495 RepID=A0ABT3U3Y0_9ACTN|nr:tRNA-dependent cyclodipeptide synthase [Streptomyces beihaiensis]MCX3063989.1 tRNA-dependent cyclodipeptide synthase [Streptomyces beihaiensis]